MKNLINGLLIFALITFSSFVQSPFAAIVPVVPAEYSTYQIKITYTGPQTRVHPSIILYGPGRLPVMSEFTPYSTPGINYSNDCALPIQLGISTTSFSRFVNALNQKPAIKVSGGSNNPVLSLMIQKGIAPGEVVFEHLADAGDAFSILNALEASVLGESTAVKSDLKKFRNYTIGYN